MFNMTCSETRLHTYLQYNTTHCAVINECAAAHAFKLSIGISVYIVHCTL